MIPQPPPGQGPIDPRQAFSPPAAPPGAPPQNWAPVPGLQAPPTTAQSGPDAQTIASKGLGPTDTKESALLATLNPGSFTAIVRGVNGATGLALVEIYDLSPAPN